MIWKRREMSSRKLDKNTAAISGIIVDGGGAGWLNGDHVEAAKLRHHLVAIHVCEDSEDDGPEIRKSFHVMKKNHLIGSNSWKTSALKVIRRLAEEKAMAVMLEFDPTSPLGFYANQLRATSILLAVHKGKTIFKRLSAGRFRGCQLDLRAELYLSGVNTRLRNAKASREDSELLAVCDSRNVHVNGHNEKALTGSISIIRRQLPESNLGWPLRRKNSSDQEAFRRSEARNVSVVQWVMSLRNRSSAETPISRNDKALETPDISFKNELEGIEGIGTENAEDCQLGTEVKHNAKIAIAVSFVVRELQQETPGLPLRGTTFSEHSNSLQEYETIDSEESESETNLSNQSTASSLQSIQHSKEMNMENNVIVSVLESKKLELPIRMNQSVCKCFSYAELKIATSNFSTENLVGEGGCSTVYRGNLPIGNSIVVKVLKSHKDACHDFFREIDIVSSIKHKHITPLFGVCIENEHLISVYDYFPEGSLEENLHGHNGRSKLEWKMRFQVAVAVAEALNYLHNECFPRVIHRDVKSSNILLSNQFQPQLSDFGLAMWGPIDSSYVINTDIVGTFGYIAPEYLMYGRVSDKIDVYAFGIVLLELLSGRRPIDFSAAKGQGSLVLWAKEVFKSGDPKALMDPKLDNEFDDFQVQRMVLAATLCINPSARLRPNVREILKLLKGEKDVEDFADFDTIGLEDLNDQDVDVIFPKFGSKPSLSFALRDIDDDLTSSSNVYTMSKTTTKNTRGRKLKDYLKEQQE